MATKVATKEQLNKNKSLYIKVLYIKKHDIWCRVCMSWLNITANQGY